MQEPAADQQQESSTTGNAAFITAPYAIRLEFFAGPMDLLLHLVNQQEVPIEQVKMSLVAEQYLQIVNSQASRLDLEKASEYLVIAATLLAIKSGSLLPVQGANEGEDIKDVYEENPFFADLKARLQAYELTKKRAEALIASPQLGVHTFVRTDRKALQPTPEMLAEPESVHQLANLFFRLMKRIGHSARSLRILAEPVAIVNFMMGIVDSLSARKDLPEGGRQGFRSILRSFLSPSIKEGLKDPATREQALRRTRGVVIGSFIAVLELVKRGLMSVSLEESEDMSLQLRMQEAGSAEQSSSLSSEFDAAEVGDIQPSEEAEAARKVVQMSDYRDAAGARSEDAQSGLEGEELVKLKEVGHA